jgi:(2Fe-2S) ferredoxin
MAHYDHIFFVCTNDRGSDSPKKSCGASGAEAVLERLKAHAKTRRGTARVRVTRAGCLGLCQKGCVVAVFSDDAAVPQTWYGHVTPADAEALFDSHVLHQTPYAPLVQPT